MQLPPTPEDDTPLRMRAYTPSQPAHVDLVCGPMFSGKTSALDGLADAAEHAGRSVFIVSPAAAERYGAEVVSTHSQRQRPCVSVALLSSIATVRGTHYWHLVLVEEGHFFGCPDLRAFVERARWCCARLVVYGLDSNSELRPFPWLGELAPLARSIQKLNGMCRRCTSGVAVCTLRREGVEGGELLVGADQEYEAVCAACHPRCAARPADAADAAPTPAAMRLCVHGSECNECSCERARLLDRNAHAEWAPLFNKARAQF